MWTFRCGGGVGCRCHVIYSLKSLRKWTFRLHPSWTWRTTCKGNFPVERVAVRDCRTQASRFPQKKCPTWQRCTTVPHFVNITFPISSLSAIAGRDYVESHRRDLSKKFEIFRWKEPKANMCTAPMEFMKNNSRFSFWFLRPAPRTCCDPFWLALFQSLKYSQLITSRNGAQRLPVLLVSAPHADESIGNYGHRYGPLVVRAGNCDVLASYYTCISPAISCEFYSPVPLKSLFHSLGLCDHHR